MAKEIERKFLVREEILTPLLQDAGVERKLIAQYYLVSSKDAAVRIRRTSGMDHAVLTVKSGGKGISTDEFEFDVPLSEYLGKLSDRVGHEIVKTRHLIVRNGRTWEVDVFGGVLEGLVVAELECDDAAEVTDLPEWVGDEVTYDSRYKNAVLAIKGRPTAGSGDTREEMWARIASNRDVMATLAALDFNNTATGELPLIEQELVIGLDSDHAQSAGMTEGLMFAPGDAVFANESIVETSASALDAAAAGHTVPFSVMDNAYEGLSRDGFRVFAERAPHIDNSQSVVTHETSDESSKMAWSAFVVEVNKER